MDPFDPDNNEFTSPVALPINGELDLHTFLPSDLPDLLEDYLLACLEKEIYQVRIVHGKGRGVLKKRVRSLLKKNPLVDAFRDAPAEAGGWGATVVLLKRSKLV